MTKKDLLRILKALANERRLNILKILANGKNLSVSDISEMINLSVKSTSKHLLKLEDAGLAKRKHVELSVFYSLESATPKEILTLLKHS